LFVKTDISLCSGCRYCEVICAFNRKSICDPSQSRIKIEKIELEGIENPIVCRQCNKPMCVKVCPTQALTKSTETEIVLYNEDKCIRCKTCIKACPFDSIWYHEETNVIIKCDICQESEPQCVKYCPCIALKLVGSK
jgi:Fe-S-cluster-containing hydrogenase component 2